MKLSDACKSSNSLIELLQKAVDIISELSDRSRDYEAGIQGGKKVENKEAHSTNCFVHTIAGVSYLDVLAYSYLSVGKCDSRSGFCGHRRDLWT